MNEEAIDAIIKWCEALSESAKATRKVLETMHKALVELDKRLTKLESNINK